MKLFTITAALATPVLANHKWEWTYHSDPTYTGGICTEAREGEYGCKSGTGGTDRDHVVICKDLAWRVVVECPWRGLCMHDQETGPRCMWA